MKKIHSSYILCTGIVVLLLVANSLRGGLSVLNIFNGLADVGMEGQQQQAQKKPRLCTSDEIRYGEFVPVTLDRPPFIPKASKCWNQEEMKTATSWPYYHWHPFSHTKNECEFRQWDPELFCLLAKNKTISLMGDSLTWEHFASLVSLLGHRLGAHDELKSRTEEGIPYDQTKPFTLDVCNKTARIGFYRNRYLSYPHWILEEQNSDIIVFNRGAHFVWGQDLIEGYKGKEHETGMKSFIKIVHTHQASCREQGRKCLTIWRTSPPGHPWCKNFTKPATNVTEMEEWVKYDPAKYIGKRHFYMWWDFQKLNNLIVGMIRNASTPEFNFEVLPGYDINILRPDAHVSEGDCLHNCDPGAADVYNTVLLHLMRLHFEE